MDCYCILLCKKVIIGSIFYICTSLTLICVVIFLQPFHAVISSCGSHRASCGKWSLPATCTQLVRRQDLQIVSTNMEQDFSGLCTLTVITDEQSKSSRKYPSCPTPDTFFFFILLLFVLHWSCALVLGGFGGCLCMVYFYGAAIWRLSKCQGHLSCSSSAPWLLCGEKERHRPILHFMTYCVKRVPRQTGGSPDVSSSWPRLTKLEAPWPIL